MVEANKIKKHNHENKLKLTAQGNTEIYENEAENILNVKETPLDILLKRVVDVQNDDQHTSNEEDKSALQKRAYDEFNCYTQIDLS